MHNPARNIWITETALSTALNTSYMAQQVSLFGIAVGAAFLLVGLVSAFSLAGLTSQALPSARVSRKARGRSLSPGPVVAAPSSRGEVKPHPLASGL